MTTAVQDRYTEHGLSLIRFSNGLTKGVNVDIRRLAAVVRSLLSTQYSPDMTPRELVNLLNEIRREISTMYGSLAVAQTDVVTELLDAEMEFATRAAVLQRRIPDGARARTPTNVLIHGASIGENWNRHRDTLTWNVTTAIRAAHAAGVERRALTAQILGNGPIGREMGGVVEGAQRAARALVDSTVQASTQTAHVAAYKVNKSNIQALQWFAILDAKVCPNCAMRAGKLYDLDMKPIKHGVAMGGTPPIHPFCRCILLPMSWPDGKIPENVAPMNDRFDKWIEKQPRDKQEHLLGVGRVDLWQQGKLSLSQLIGQDGLIMSLEDLKKRIAIP